MITSTSRSLSGPKVCRVAEPNNMIRWRAWSAIPVFALAYVTWNVGRRRWDNDTDPASVPWYALCHGAWAVLTAYGMWLVGVG